MIDPTDPTDEGPTLEEAQALAQTLVPESVVDAADLPDDVRDGEAGHGEDDPAVTERHVTTDE